MKDKNIICKHYVRAGVCSISNKECHVWREMQTCPFYEKKTHALPIRADRRKRKLEDARRKDSE